MAVTIPPGQTRARFYLWDTVVGTKTLQAATVRQDGFTLPNATQVVVIETGLVSAALTGVFASSLTANWGSQFPAGTIYTVQASTAWDYSGALLSSATLNLFATLTGLDPNSIYYARIGAGGGYTSLGTTVTLIQTPTALYFDEVSTTSLVVSAYAPTPAFSNLGAGLSGTNIAKDGVYAGWHGESWTVRASMANARQGMAAGVIAGELYAAGGWGASTAVTVHEKYDPVADTWTARSAIPTARAYLAAGVLEGRLHAAGGMLGSGQPTSVHQSYDPLADQWSSRASLPSARNDLAGAVAGGKLYAVGGTDGVSILGLNQSYDPASDAWTTRSALATGRHVPSARAADGIVYAVGGTLAGGANSNLNTAYDPALDSWTSKSILPTARGSLAAARLGGKLYVVGGHDGVSGRELNDEYDPGADAWVRRAAMPTARYNLTLAALGGRLYAVGGTVTGVGVTAANEVYDPGVAQRFAGLTPNTLYAFKAKARNSLGVETGEVTASTYTAAAVPSTATPTFLGVFAGSVTLQWSANGNPAGTGYRLQASTASDFNAAASSAATGWATTLSASLSSLGPNTTWHFRAQARNAVGLETAFASLGSTVTLIETPTALYFDEVSSNSLVAAAYAPTPAFSNLGAGLSGTNIAKDGVYAGWHGERWTAKAAMPTARYALSLAASSGRLYAMGGWTVSATTAHQEYDPLTDSWSSRAALPTARLTQGAAALGGKLYVVGGENAGGQLALNQRYDPDSDSWSTRTALPAVRAGQGFAVLDGKAVSVGGLGSSGYVTDVRAYDPATDAWTARAALPFINHAMAAASVAGRLYSMGGSSGATTSAGLRYDPSLDSWTAVSSMPTGVNYPGSAVIGAKLYVFGGTDASGTNLALAQEYDPAVDAWTLRAPMPSTRTRLGAAAVGGRAYAVGGTNGAGGLSANEEYDPGVAQRFTGLAPNTLYTFRAKARNRLGVETSETSPVSTYTAAAVPSTATPTFLGVFAGSVTLQWTANGNPAGTEYRVSASTAADHNAAAGSAITGWLAALSATVAGLEPDSTWYFRVQARNAVAVETDFITLGSTATPYAPVTRVWDGGGASTRASETANWAGDRLPSADDAVRFDAASSKDCQWDLAEIALSSLTVDAGYGGTVTLSSNVTVSGGIVASGGHLRVPWSGSTVTVLGSIANREPGRVTWGKGLLRLSGDLRLDAGNTVGQGDSLLEFDGSSFQVVSGTGSGILGNVDVNSSSEVYFQRQSGSVWSYGMSLRSGRLNFGGLPMYTVQYDWNQTGGQFIAGQSTVVFNGWTEREVSVLPGNPFWTLRVGFPPQNVWKGHLRAASALDVDGDLIISSGSFDAGAFTHTVGGDWEHMAGTFTHSGVIRLDGPAPSLMMSRPDASFQELQVAKTSTLTVTAGSTVTVATLSIGDPSLAPRLRLRSGAPGAPWYLVVTGTASATRAEVSDSDASGGIPILAAAGDNVNSGANVNWDFGAPAPAAPDTPAASVGTSSIAWTWSAVSGAESYRVYSATSGALLAQPMAASFLQSGLAPNTTSSIAVAAVRETKTGALSAASTAQTYALAPAGLAADAVHGSSAVLSWSLNGNPDWTAAELQRSTDGAAYATRLLAPAATFADENLLGCATYHYRVRSRNGAGVLTAFDGPLSFRTLASTPLPPGQLSAASLEGRRIQLDWTASPTEGITAYRLYASTPGAPVDYSAPYAVFGPAERSTTTAALASAGIYTFGLRALHRCGVEEANVSVRASATALESVSGVRAVIKVPETGKKISGNRVLVMAGLASGDPAQTRSVRFQYRASSASAWADVPAANAEHPNPNLDHPYFVHWDVTALADGDYDLRAVATDVFGSSDPAPGAISVAVDAVGFDVRETDLGGGKVKKEQKVHVGADNTVSAAERDSDVVTKVMLPAGAISDSTATLTVTVNPPATPPPPSDAQPVGAALEVTLSNGQEQLSGGRTAALVFNYPDGNGDGVVDGTTLRADKLEVRTFHVPSNSWRKEAAAVVDKDARTVTAQTPHFSFFALFGTLASTLDSIRVYPNPWKPNGGNVDEGKPFSPADATSGVVFDNLPASVRITIYTLTGSEVASFSTDSGTGALQWDGRNSSGRDVASGGYFAVITSPGQSPVIRKIAVIR